MQLTLYLSQVVTWSLNDLREKLDHAGEGSSSILPEAKYDQSKEIC